MAGRLAITDRNNPYFIDSPQRVEQVQAEMHKAGIDLYLGSRLRTLSWIADVFVPWRSYVLIPAAGMPFLFTFFIDAARISSETWLDADHVLGYLGLPGMEPIPNIASVIKAQLKSTHARIGFEDGISVYTPEGYLTRYEHALLQEQLPGAELVDAHEIIDRVSLFKDRGTINRFREAGRICDCGHQAVVDAVRNGGWKRLTETAVGGIAAAAMRRAGVSRSGTSPA